MTNRPRYTTAQLARFITLARGGRDRRTTLALLDDDEKGYAEVRTPGGPQTLTVITEAGTLPTTTPEDNT